MAEDERKIYEIHRWNSGPFVSILDRIGEKTEVKRGTTVELSTYYSGEGGGGDSALVEIPEKGNTVRVRFLKEENFVDHDLEKDGFLGFNDRWDWIRDYVRLERRIPYALRKARRGLVNKLRGN